MRPGILGRRHLRSYSRWCRICRLDYRPQDAYDTDVATFSHMVRELDLRVVQLQFQTAESQIVRGMRMTLAGVPEIALGAGTLMMAGSPVIEMRIRGGSRGVLELRIDGGQWDAVCDDYFDSNNNQANAVCRTLGYDGGTHYDTTHGDSSFASTICNVLLGLRHRRMQYEHGSVLAQLR